MGFDNINISDRCLRYRYKIIVFISRSVNVPISLPSPVPPLLTHSHEIIMSKEGGESIPFIGEIILFTI